MSILFLKTSLIFFAIIASIQCFNTESLDAKQIGDLARKNHNFDARNHLDKFLKVFSKGLILKNNSGRNSSNRKQENSKKSWTPWKLPTNSLKWYAQNLRKSTAPHKMYIQLYKALNQKTF